MKLSSECCFYFVLPFIEADCFKKKKSKDKECDSVGVKATGTICLVRADSCLQEKHTSAYKILRAMINPK